MKDQKLSRQVITDPRLGMVFTNPNQRRILMWFTGGARSAGEAAAALGMDLRRLHYHLGRMKSLGLLTEVGHRRRPGRPIKLYRAVGDSFFIPNEALAKGFGEDLATELRASLADRSSRDAGGILFRATAAGSIRGRIVRSSGKAGGAFEAWRILRLSGHDLGELQQELNAVLNKFQRRSVANGQIFLVHAAAAPRLNALQAVDNSA